MNQKRIDTIIYSFFAAVFVINIVVDGDIVHKFSQTVLLGPLYLNYKYFVPWLLQKGKVSYWLLWFFLFWTFSFIIYSGVFYVAWLYKDIPYPFPWLQILPSSINVTFLLASMSAGCRLAREWNLNQWRNQELLLQKSLAELQLMKSNINLPFVLEVLDHAEKQALRAPESIEESIMYLSNLLRHSLYESKVPSISLENELKVLQEFMTLYRQIHPQSNISLKVGSASCPKKVPPNLLLRTVGHWLEHLQPKLIYAMELSLEQTEEELQFRLPVSQLADHQKVLFEQKCMAYKDVNYSVSYTWTEHYLIVKILSLVS